MLSLSLLVGCGAQQSAGEPETAVREGVPTDGSGWYLWNEDETINREGRGASGANAVVSSAKVEASLAGKAVLEAGGNAIDAAIATAFALGVVEPNASGIGGGGFMLVRSADGESRFINFREVAPALAELSKYELGEDGRIKSGEKSTGGKAVAIPGEVAGLWYAYENYGSGKLSWAELVQPAIDLAHNGYYMTETLLVDVNDAFNYLMEDEQWSSIYLEDGFAPSVGFRVVNEPLARTLEMIAEGGRDAFYTGEIAEQMVSAVQEAGGFLTMEDLANYEVRVSEPAKGSYRGYTVLSSPLPSSGGTHVIEALNILENFEMSGYGFDSAERLHLLAETFGVVFRDRDLYMGDPEYTEVPETALLSKEYAASVADQFTDTGIADYTDVDPWQYEHEDTTHFSVADAQGNMVAVTQTINLAFGSKVIVGGFALNDEMNDFSSDPASPNAIAPGKTPLSSMSPTIVLDEKGDPFMVLGTPGAVRIITAVTQVISSVIDYNMDIEQAINAPRVHTDTRGKLYYEDRFDAATVEALAAMGYETENVDEYYRSYGSVQAVLYGSDGQLNGGADSRRDGKALAY